MVTVLQVFPTGDLSRAAELVDVCLSVGMCYETVTQTFPPGHLTEADIVGESVSGLSLFDRALFQEFILDKIEHLF